MSIKKAYNIWAEQYDSNDNKTRDLDKVATIDTLTKFSFRNVLELGCGTGKNTTWLVKNAKSIIALDFSQEMLGKAKAKIQDEKVVFKTADLTKTWDLKNNSIDLITCSLTLEHIKNITPIFKQAFDKLEKNGLFFICELHPFKQYLGSKACYEDESGVHELEVFIHPISEYVTTAKNNGFTLIEIEEWFDKDKSTTNDIPRLISFVFKKL